MLRLIHFPLESRLLRQRLIFTRGFLNCDLFLLTHQSVNTSKAKDMNKMHCSVATQLQTLTDSLKISLVGGTH